MKSSDLRFFLLLIYGRISVGGTEHSLIVESKTSSSNKGTKPVKEHNQCLVTTRRVKRSKTNPSSLKCGLQEIDMLLLVSYKQGGAKTGLKVIEEKPSALRSSSITKDPHNSGVSWILRKNCH